MKLKDLDFIKLLPEFMRKDEAVKSLSDSINRNIHDLGRKIKYPRVWDQIDNLDHKQLDEIAWELDIDWYNSSMNLTRKRDTIKTAVLVKSKRGTTWAVQEFINATFGGGELKEWYEYGGLPFYFKVVLSEMDIENESINQFLRGLQKVKNTRSHLEEISFSRNQNAEIYAGFHFELISKQIIIMED